MTFDDRAADHRSRATLALTRGEWEEAEQQLQALIAISPDDAIAWNNLGVALEHQHKTREAIVAYSRAAALLPDSDLPGRNLLPQMQRYLGWATAFALFTVIDIALRFVPISTDARTVMSVGAFILLAFGAWVYYQRQREQLPDEAWRAYKSEMARTRRLRYVGLAFVFIGFLVFAVVFFILVVVGGRDSDGTVVLVAVAGLCWLIVARLLWAHAIAPRLVDRIR
jgi:tetratricopeptide (TPR) repeat protein